MATSEPWLTLGRSFDACVRVLRDPSLETYVAVDNDGVAGFVVVSMRGELAGYIKSVAVREDVRGRGIGTRLIEFAEARIRREHANVFICASSFNLRARQLYQRLGYTVVGELTDYVVRGHSEWLLRKSWGPIAEFAPEPEAAPERWERDGYVVSTDRSRLDLDVVHGFLTRSYWSPGVEMKTIARAIEHSLPFGLYSERAQIGFMRVVSDYATYAYLADVFVLEEYRGRGLGKWLVETALGHPRLQGLRSWSLRTRDAHGLYRQLGFESITDSSAMRRPGSLPTPR